MPLRRILLLVLLTVSLAACAPPGSGETGTKEEILEVEDVAPPVDVGLSTEADVKGPPMIQGVSGILPSDYPRGLPTHEPSSVSDFGSVPGGARFVEFDSPTGAAEVESSLAARLGRSEWQHERTGSGRLRAVKEGSEVTIVISDLYSGSRIRVEYR